MGPGGMARLGPGGRTPDGPQSPVSARMYRTPSTVAAEPQTVDGARVPEHAESPSLALPARTVLRLRMLRT
eukprot:12884765-Prorocentrum_lima.AAC.1